MNQQLEVTDDWAFDWPVDEELDQALKDIGYEFDPNIMYFKDGQAYLKRDPFVEADGAVSGFAYVVIQGFKNLTPVQRGRFLTLVGDVKGSHRWATLPTNMKWLVLLGRLPEPIVERWLI